MKKEFSGNLSGLKPHHRFQLSVKALARGDTAFYKQLVRSCPREETVEYLDLLKGARDCAIHATLALHMVFAQLEMINALVLQPLDLDSRHVEYFYTKFRKHPELSEDNRRIVEDFYESLSERSAGDDDDSSSPRLSTNAFALFLPHLFYVHSYGVEGVYVSEEETFKSGLVDSVLCMIACYHLDIARASIAESLSILWPAFGSVCRSGMSLEPDIMMKAFGSPAAVSLIKEFSYELKEMGVESNINEAWESSLCETWNQ